MCSPTNSSLLSLTLIHISLAPLCLTVEAAALTAQQQVFLLSGTPPGPLEEQSMSSLTLHHSPPSVSASSLEMPWQKPEGLVGKGFFTLCFQLSFNMGLSPTHPQNYTGGLEW